MTCKEMTRPLCNYSTVSALRTLSISKRGGLSSFYHGWHWQHFGLGFGGGKERGFPGFEPCFCTELCRVSKFKAILFTRQPSNVGMDALSVVNRLVIVQFDSGMMAGLHFPFTTCNPKRTVSLHRDCWKIQHLSYAMNKLPPFRGLYIMKLICYPHH